VKEGSAIATPQAAKTRDSVSRPWLSRKRLFQFHGWLGMTFGALLFVICLSGSAAALSHEIDWLLNPAVRAFPTGAPRLGWEDWVRAARQAQPDWHVRWVEAPFNAYAAVEVVLDAPSGLWRRIYVHPETGRVQGYSSYFNVQRFLRDFHRLLNIFTWGLFLVSAFALVLLLSIVSGLLFYKNWWRNLFQLRLRKGGRAFASDLHRMLGTWTFVFGAIISVTGIWYFCEQTLATYSRDSFPKPLFLSRSRLASHGPTPQFASADRLAAAARQAFPDLRIVAIHFPLTNQSPVRIYGQGPALLVRDAANTVSLDPYSAEVLDVQRAENLPAGERLAHTADPLHFGDFGGLATKLLWSFFGLALPVMILAGSYLSIRRTGERSEWLRIRRWTLGTWASLFIFCYALYCCVPAATRYKTPAIPAFAPQGEVQVGPWQVRLEAAAHTIRATAANANFKAVSIAFSDSAKPQPLKPRALAYQSAALELPDNYDGDLRILIEDWNGVKHRARHGLAPSAFNSQARVIPEEGASTGTGTWFFLVPFMAVIVGTFLVWTARFGHWRL
jgi:uncharacterized iron-regulated membrane protein